MQDHVTTSWRRRSDLSADPHGKRADTPQESPMRSNAERLETWEDEGGRTGRASSEILRVLVVDNDMRSADAIELMVHAAGYPETRVAYSAHAALALAVEFRPDVALVEMNLLDMDSNELAQLLRERAQLRHLRLIAMTSSRQYVGWDIARNAGFERYLLKPIAAADLSNLLAKQSHGELTPQG
jgi:CheY-like chemotaxis protein